MNGTDTRLDDEQMPFEVSCPGVLELPGRSIQFFNLWDDPTAPGGWVVTVAIDDDTLFVANRHGHVSVVALPEGPPARACACSGR